jgi:hypothetical protein
MGARGAFRKTGSRHSCRAADRRHDDSYLLGAADLIAAITLDVLSANGFAFRLTESGAGSNAVQYLPWSLIPTVLVPFYLIIHGVIFAQLRMGRRVSAANGAQ